MVKEMKFYLQMKLVLCETAFRENTCFFFQMDITMLADHIMEASTCGLKQGALEAESDSGKVGIGGDVRFLSGYLSEVER